MDPDGENPRKVTSAEKGRWIWGSCMSPDGQRLAYQNSGPEGIATESRKIDGGPQVTILPSNPSLEDWCLTSDGIVYLMAEQPPNEDSNNFWEIKVDPGTGRPITVPRRITKWLGYWHSNAQISGRQAACLPQRSSYRLPGGNRSVRFWYLYFVPKQPQKGGPLERALDPS
jgi:hypothetical protein